MHHFASIEEADEYVSHAIESEGEQRAEYGSGAVSLGYDPYEWALAYDGYRTSDDPMFREAEALLIARYRTVKVIKPGEPGSLGYRAFDTSDDIPW